jgi:hypothetical protein
MVTPRIIKKSNTTIHRLMGNPSGLSNVFRESQSMATKTHHTNLLVMPAELPGWNPPANRPALRQTQPWN